MPLGLLDLSLVTDLLISKLNTWTINSKLWDEDKTGGPVTPPFPIKYTGLAPDAARVDTTLGDCHVCVYLFHVAADKFHRNTYPLGGQAQTIPTQPFALDLYYLLTAYSKSSYIHEQQAMSIALKCFHEIPILTAAVPIDKREEEFTLTIEPQTIDEISRLWQAINAPLRLSAVYRVSVIFLEAPAAREAGVVRHPAHVTVETLKNGAASTQSNVAGTIEIKGTGLFTITVTGAGFANGKTEVRIRARALTSTTSAPLAGQFQVVNSDRLDVRVPLFTPRGEYLLSVRPGPDRPTLDFELNVLEQIVLVDAGNGLVTINIDDAAFAAGTATVAIDGPPGTALAKTVANPPAAGQFRFVDKETLQLRIPAGTPSGRHLLTLGRGPNQPALKLQLNVP